MIPVHILIGCLCTSVISYLIYYANKKHIKLKVWQWFIVIIEVLYIAFVLELIAGFIEEGSGRAALVMGLIFGLLALIGAVLIMRFIFSKGSKN